MVDQNVKQLSSCSTYNEPSITFVVIPPKQKLQNLDVLPVGQFHLPVQKYKEGIPIYFKKNQNLQDLQRICENFYADTYTFKPQQNGITSIFCYE